jgi:hypothetical protein
MSGEELRAAVMEVVAPPEPAVAGGGDPPAGGSPAREPAISLLGDGKDGWAVVAAVRAAE